MNLEIKDGELVLVEYDNQGAIRLGSVSLTALAVALKPYLDTMDLRFDVSVKKQK